MVLLPAVLTPWFPQRPTTIVVPSLPPSSLNQIRPSTPPLPRTQAKLKSQVERNFHLHVIGREDYFLLKKAFVDIDTDRDGKVQLQELIDWCAVNNLEMKKRSAAGSLPLSPSQHRNPYPPYLPYLPLSSLFWIPTLTWIKSFCTRIQLCAIQTLPHRSEFKSVRGANM